MRFNISLISERVTRISAMFTFFLFILPLVILLLVGQQLTFTTHNDSPDLALLTGALVGLPALFVWIFFSNTLTYWLICGGGILFALISFCWGNPSKMNKIWSLTLLILILFGMLTPYAPAVQPSNGHLMLSATPPMVFERGLKNLQAFGEVTSCGYALNGWEKQSLFYTETCANSAKVFQFDLSSQKSTVASVATRSLLTQKIPNTAVLDYVQVANIKPAEAELSVRGLSVKGDGMLSPNGEWLALVTRYLYGPEDVVVIKVQPDQPNH